MNEISSANRAVIERLGGLLSGSCSPPVSAAEAIRLWDDFASQYNQSIAIISQLLEHHVHDLSLPRIENILSLSGIIPNTDGSFIRAQEATSRERRKKVLQLYYSWSAWPWTLLNPPSNTQTYSKGLLEALVSLNQAGCHLTDARYYLSRAHQERAATGRGSSPDLLVADVRRALYLFRELNGPSRKF